MSDKHHDDSGTPHKKTQAEIDAESAAGAGTKPATDPPALTEKQKKAQIRKEIADIDFDIAGRQAQHDLDIAALRAKKADLRSRLSG